MESTNRIMRSDTSEIDLSERKILIVDDQDFNIDALIIILGFILKINVDKVCERAWSGD